MDSEGTLNLEGVMDLEIFVDSEGVVCFSSLRYVLKHYLKTILIIKNGEGMLKVVIGL